MNQIKEECRKSVWFEVVDQTRFSVNQQIVSRTENGAFSLILVVNQNQKTGFFLGFFLKDTGRKITRKIKEKLHEN